MLKKPVFWIVVALAVVLIGALTVRFKRYYDDRYALEDYYYAVVPPDCDYTPTYAVDDGGRIMGLKATYRLTGYSADGAARDLEFDVFLDMQELYPPGTYVKVGMSKQWVTDKRALPEADVPETALAEIRAHAAPLTARTLAEYADERTRLLGANAPAARVVCEPAETALFYVYVYDASAKPLAEEAAEFLDPVFRAQFRADNALFPALTAIFLEIRLEDETVIFSQKYDTRVTFGYEDA